MSIDSSSLDALVDANELETLRLSSSGRCVTVQLHRPKRRNAVNSAMVRELRNVFCALDAQSKRNIVVIRGAGGHFCAGGDIQDMSSVGGSDADEGEPPSDFPNDPVARHNRQFGHLLEQIAHSSCVVVAVLEGTVLGGGFGLACVSDIAITLANSKFGMPETSLGIPPAQIAPFVVQRVGLTHARSLALTARRFDGTVAHQLGVATHLCDDTNALATTLEEVLGQICRCAPGASAVTKQLMIGSARRPLADMLDEGARRFSEAIAGTEAMEGFTAFISKSKPPWAVSNDNADGGGSK